ncbi:unnamed protein product [Heligmosomoides polygyrus]|uniref:Winged helix-turn-helix domain-containing protein n=1 Tax=Heligmosomoides polygyrus TaxID=6339 RepID=A0A3P7YW09_HELPZ|nr:unnamed protein product [Heligmosomoides polygyrus]
MLREAFLLPRKDVWDSGEAAGAQPPQKEIISGRLGDGATKKWSGRESDVDNDRLRQLVELDPRRTTRELAQDLGVHYSTFARHLRQLGKVHKLAQWVPHDLTEPTASDVLRWPLNRSRTSAQIVG